MGGDLKPDLSALQVKVLFTKQHSYLLRKTTNVHTAGRPFCLPKHAQIENGVCYLSGGHMGR